MIHLKDISFIKRPIGNGVFGALKMRPQFSEVYHMERE
jgi:hypothetical protein